MKVKELIAAALADKRTHKMAGKTPEATLAAQIYVAANGKKLTTEAGQEGTIKKQAPGLVAWVSAS